MKYRIIENPLDLATAYQDTPGFITGPIGTTFLVYKDLIVLLNTKAAYSEIDLDKEGTLEMRHILAQKFFPNHKFFIRAEDKSFTKHIEY